MPQHPTRTRSPFRAHCHLQGTEPLMQFTAEDLRGNCSHLRRCSWGPGTGCHPWYLGLHPSAIRDGSGDPMAPAGLAVASEAVASWVLPHSAQFCPPHCFTVPRVSPRKKALNGVTCQQWSQRAPSQVVGGACCCWGGVALSQGVGPKAFKGTGPTSQCERGTGDIGAMGWGA